MKKLILICGMFFLCSRLLAQPAPSVNRVTFDSLATNPIAPNSAYQSILFFKAAPGGGVGVYRLYRGTVKRIDTTFSTPDSVHISGVSRETKWFTKKKLNPVSGDSSYVTEVPSPQTWTLDSVKAGKKGAFTGTVNVDRLRSGTYARMFSVSYTLTTTMTTMGTPTNNTLIAGDQIFVVWSTPGGTTASNDEINWTGFYRLTQ